MKKILFVGNWCGGELEFVVEDKELIIASLIRGRWHGEAVTEGVPFARRRYNKTKNCEAIYLPCPLPTVHCPLSFF